MVDGELGRHGLAHDDAAGLASQGDARRITSRTVPGIDRRAVGRGHVAGVEDVFYAERHAEEWS
jgi:hypothetical protein